MTFRTAPTLPRWLLVLGLALYAGTSAGIDLTPWARHARPHRDWTSLDFRHPVTGLFLASRAGTEDKRTQATLTLTALPAQGCVADVVIVLKEDQPASRDSVAVDGMTVSFDEDGSRQVRVLLVRQAGDRFVFARILDALPPETLKAHGSMTVSLPNGRSAVFSLKGFESAWRTAEAACLSFLGP